MQHSDTNTKWKQADKGYQYIHGVGNCIGIYAQDRSGIVAFVFQKDGEDNAPVIAAAPDLLEAVKYALGLSVLILDNSYRARFEERMNAAIAKALPPQ